MIKTKCTDTLNLSSKILSAMGILHTTKLTNFDTVKVMFNYLICTLIFTVCILNIIDAIKASNQNHAFLIAGMLVPLATYTAKTIAPLLNKGCWVLALHYLESDIFNCHSEKLNRHIQLIDKLSRFILYYFIVAALITVTVYAVLPLLIDVQVLLLAPFNTGRFEFVYNLLHLFSISYMGVNSVSLDVFNMTLLALAIAQLNILQEQLSSIMENAKYIHIKANMSSYSKRNLSMRFVVKECIILYEAINQYVETINALLAFPLCTQYLSGCFAVCSAIVQITILNVTYNKLIGNMVAYCSITFAQMTAYHWLANEIMCKSDKITEACYLSRWYELNISSQRTLILLMERAKRPFILRLYGLISITLESLVVIVRWSYSIFALIKAKYK